MAHTLAPVSPGMHIKLYDYRGVQCRTNPNSDPNPNSNSNPNPNTLDPNHIRNPNRSPNPNPNPDMGLTLTLSLTLSVIEGRELTDGTQTIEEAGDIPVLWWRPS